LAQSVKILVPESLVGFQIVAFSPFIPGFDKNDPIFRFPVLHQLHRLMNMTSEQLRSGTGQDHSPRARPGRIVPARNDTRITIWFLRKLLKEKPDCVLITVYVWGLGRKQVSNLPSKIETDSATGT
jgi:hypothetical protein